MAPKEFVKKWFESIDAHKFDELSNMMDESHKFFNPMTPEPADKESHIGMIQMLTSAFGGHKHHLDVVVVDGDWAAVRGRLIAKHTGEFNGIPATGKSVEFSWIDMMHLVNGKVKEEYFEFNPSSMMQQIQ